MEIIVQIQSLLEKLSQRVNWDRGRLARNEREARTPLPPMTIASQVRAG
jgi:hypothetical protein